MIKAVIFDCGGVILDYDLDIFFNKLAKHSSHSHKELRKLIFKDSDLEKLYETGLISSDEFYHDIVKLCNLKMSKKEFVKAFTNIFKHIQPTFRLIKKLKKNYKIALLSNINEWDFTLKVKHEKIYKLFDAVTLSYKAKSMKPHRKIYLDCLKKLKLKPKECVFIDDLEKNIIGAEKLGINGIQYISAISLENSLRRLGVEF